MRKRTRIAATVNADVAANIQQIAEDQDQTLSRIVDQALKFYLLSLKEPSHAVPGTKDPATEDQSNPSV